MNAYRTHVYCGPTIGSDEVVAILPDAQAHPPVRHGDLLRLDTSPGDVVVIIDGVFHQAPPVRHKEILYLLSRGVRVVGAASMGALRAAELYPYGMIGVGQVYSAYVSGRRDADDEVAVACGPDDYHQVSEALVDIEAMADLAVAAGVITEDAGRALVSCARGIYYPGRTWSAIRHADPAVADTLDHVREWAVNQRADYRAKHADAVEALRMVAAGQLPQAGAFEADLGTEWRTYFLRHWVARYHGTVVDGTGVPYLAVLQHQQLYDPGFPDRWRRYVLSWIAGVPYSTDLTTVERGALQGAKARGIAIAHLSESQLAYWLTERELVLPDEQRLLRILVRSVPRSPSTNLWPTSEADAPHLLDPGIRSATVVVSAFRRNRDIANSGPRRTVHDLNPQAIRAYLADLWTTAVDDDHQLTALARDRGFHDLHAAVNAARLFVLSAPPADERALNHDQGREQAEHPAGLPQGTRAG